MQAVHSFPPQRQVLLLPALIKSVDLDTAEAVLLQDLLCVIISVERIHQHKRNVSVVGLV